MFAGLLNLDSESNSPAPREGELFKVIRLYGQTFEIRYGFYEDEDRNYHFAEPIEIYPDFIKHPVYTMDGQPFVTAIQEPCKFYDGKRHDNITCEECSYYLQGEELIGVCACPKNKRSDCG